MQFFCSLRERGLTITSLAVEFKIVYCCQVISQWESHLLRWGGYTASFVSLHSHLGLHDLDNVLSGKSSLVVGLHNVGKTSLVDHVRKNRATDARFDLCTVIRKVTYVISSGACIPVCSGTVFIC